MLAPSFSKLLTSALRIIAALFLFLAYGPVMLSVSVPRGSITLSASSLVASSQISSQKNQAAIREVPTNTAAHPQADPASSSLMLTIVPHALIPARPVVATSRPINTA
jgi:hypothetical protein